MFLKEASLAEELEKAPGLRKLTDRVLDEREKAM
jgi:hypothetical protein